MNVVAAPTSPGGVWLITPATAPHRFDTAHTAGADVALLDLEDSVPDADKTIARRTAIDWLSTVAPAAATVLGMRVNALSTTHGLQDLTAIARANTALSDVVLLLPKVEAARDVELAALALGAADGPRRIWALIETPRAIARLAEILSARQLAGVVFGAADYAAAAGCALTTESLRYPRAALVAAAAAAGLPAIDTPSFDLTDTAALRRDAEDARDLGFVGKGAVHTGQLAVIREAFRPSPQQVAAARAVVAAADKVNGGVTTAGAQMVGPPLVTGARTVLARVGNVDGRGGEGMS